MYSVGILGIRFRTTVHDYREMILLDEVWKSASVSSVLECGNRVGAIFNTEMWPRRRAHRERGDTDTSASRSHKASIVTSVACRFNLGMACLAAAIIG